MGGGGHVWSEMVLTLSSSFNESSLFDEDICRVSSYPYIKAWVTVSSIVFVGVLSQGSVGLASLVYKPSHDSYWCSTFAITFTYAFHPEVIQGHVNCLRQNAWYAELSKSIIQPVWMCIAEFAIGISFIQCSTNRWILGSQCRGSGDREKKWEEMVPKIPFFGGTRAFRRNDSEWSQVPRKPNN